MLRITKRPLAWVHGWCCYKAKNQLRTTAAKQHVCLLPADSAPGGGIRIRASYCPPPVTTSGPLWQGRDAGDLSPPGRLGAGRPGWGGHRGAYPEATRQLFGGCGRFFSTRRRPRPPGAGGGGGQGRGAKETKNRGGCAGTTRIRKKNVPVLKQRTEVEIVVFAYLARGTTAVPCQAKAERAQPRPVGPSQPVAPGCCAGWLGCRASRLDCRPCSAALGRLAGPAGQPTGPRSQRVLPGLETSSRESECRGPGSPGAWLPRARNGNGSRVCDVSRKAQRRTHCSCSLQPAARSYWLLVIRREAPKTEAY
jgi:hypothetical protein